MKLTYTRILGWGVLVGALLFSPLRAQTVVIGDISNNPTGLFAFKILKLALSKTAPEITFHMERGIKSNQKTWNEALKQGQLSVIWAGATKELERQFLPVRIPVFKGLLGYRVFIIHKEDQARFDQIGSIAQLKSLVAGSGQSWGDTAILQANGLSSKVAPGYMELLDLLVRGKIDYFPRALHEPWGELQQFGSAELAVERNLLLVYPYPMYFFVAPDNQPLHDQISRGLEMAIEDGSFDALFYSHPTIQAILARANLGQRKILRLINPYLSPETPFYRRELWLAPDSLQRGCHGDRCADALDVNR